MTDPEEDRATVCPLCAVGCTLAKPQEGTRAEGRAGPANPNGRLCRKGIHAFERTDREHRLTEPRIRTDGTLRAVPWERAYDRVVAGIEATIDAHGPDALAFLGAPHCTTEENYLLQKLARSLGTNNVDNRARHCHVSTTRALTDRFGFPATTNSLDDLHSADVVLAVGANPARRQPIAFNSHVRPAVTDGTSLVHVDPVGNETTRLADIHLAPVPGTDALVLEALCAQVVEDGRADRGFLDRRTEGAGEFLASLADVEVTRAAGTAGVDGTVLEQVAGLVGGADRTAAIVGTGVEDDDRGRDAAHALLNLLLLTGNVGRRGTGLHVFRGPPNEQGAVDAGCVPDRLPGHQPVTDPQARARVAEEWGVEPPGEPGGTATALLASFGEEIHAAVVVGENPAVSKRDRGWVQERLAALDTLVVVELRESATTAHADVVLPAGAGVEKAGTLTNLDRRIQRLHPLRPNPGRARPDLRILSDVARRLPSADAGFEADSPAAVFAEFARIAPSHTGIRYEELEAGGRRWPADAGPVLYTGQFDTPDGLARFVTPERPSRPPADEGLSLVVGGRAGGVGSSEDGRAVRMHPGDASDRDVTDGDPVTVTDDRHSVAGVADVDTAVRPGTVFLHADPADPFVRAGTTTVRVAPRTDGERERER
jgi:predicted molibdopterin-dependent oxidoreductase YjgC